MEYTPEVLEKKINYIFRDKSLLRQAVTHSSFCNEQKINKQKHYERLEFLGDAILELVSSEFLFHEYKDKPEGELTRMRASIVCEPTLAICARDINLDKFILLGNGEEITGGRSRDSIISDAMEALIGAIYLDGGFAIAKDFIKKYILNDIESKQLFYDSKTILQEMVQKNYKERVLYELVGESGPDHNKTFEVDVLLGEKVIGHGIGRTKRKAEQQAAYEAIIKINNSDKQRG